MQVCQQVNIMSTNSTYDILSTKIDLPHLILLPKNAYNKHEENPFHAVHFQVKAFDLCCFAVKHCSENS